MITLKPIKTSIVYTSLAFLHKLSPNMGLPLNEILKSLQSFAPTSSACDWDNVGLLIDPMSSKKVKTILLTNDLTEDVVNEAVTEKAGLIVSYHPNIFKPLKAITAATWKERIIVQCIRNEIAVFSPHSSWDNSPSGVSSWLAKMFSFKNVEPVADAGRLVTLQVPTALSAILSTVKKYTETPSLQLGLARNKNLDSLVSTVALCAGSGASILRDTPADLYLTGEMSHHEVLDATQRGTHVILTNHSNSERGFLKAFQPILETQLLGGEVEVLISKVDKDPLVTV